MLSKAQTSSGLAFVGAAHNLTLVLLPVISIAVLDATSFDGVALMVIGFVVVGPGAVIPAAGAAGGATRRPPRWARRAGGSGSRSAASGRCPLLIVVTYVAHWGAITAYLPVRASEAGADIGLYFAADGMAIFAMRIPTGWLTNRVSTRNLIVVGALPRRSPSGCCCCR